MTAPPFAYFGGKTLLADRIAGLLPRHEHYVEPFAGGLSVLLAKPRSFMETVNDLDERLMLFWRVLRERPQDLAQVCTLTPHSRAEYLACREVDEDPPGDDLETARRVWVRLSQGRGGAQQRTGWRNYQTRSGTSLGMPGYLEAYVRRIAPAAERLAGVSLECRPALEVIDAYGRSGDVLLYVDPPYLGSTRTGGKKYHHDMQSAGEHVELLRALRAARAAVVLSGYDSPLYAEHLDGWDRRTFRSITNGGDSMRATRTEVLWSNRPLPQPGLWDATG